MLRTSVSSSSLSGSGKEEGVVVLVVVVHVDVVDSKMENVGEGVSMSLFELSNGATVGNESEDGKIETGEL